MAEPPRLVAVIGANGAGKSTWCERQFAQLPQPFFDADSIAQGLGSYDDIGDQRQARRIVDQGIAECLDSRSSFGLETTYSGQSRPRLIREAHRRGYVVRGIFIGTVSWEINIRRVRYRVANQTGHDVPVAEIRRRWQACQDNLVQTASCFERVRVLDNSGKHWVEAGEVTGGKLLQNPAESPDWASKLLSRIAAFHP